MYPWPRKRRVVEGSGKRLETVEKSTVRVSVPENPSGKDQFKGQVDKNPETSLPEIALEWVRLLRVDNW